MARRRSDHPFRNRKCRDLRQDGETFYRGLCETCRTEAACERRAETAARALAKAKEGGTIERDGRTFSVVVLPAKRHVEGASASHRLQELPVVGSASPGSGFRERELCARTKAPKVTTTAKVEQA
jgi:hypothetical protein